MVSIYFSILFFFFIFFIIFIFHDKHTRTEHLKLGPLRFIICAMLSRRREQEVVLWILNGLCERREESENELVIDSTWESNQVSDEFVM